MRIPPIATAGKWLEIVEVRRFHSLKGDSVQEYVKRKIDALERERAELDELLAQTDNLLEQGMIYQEITRNEGLIALYHALCDQQGWVRS